MQPPAPDCLFDRRLFADATDPRFHFALAVPAGWRQVPVAEPTTRPAGKFAPLVRFADPGPSDAEVVVSFGLCLREVAAGDLAHTALTAAGGRVVGRWDDPAAPAGNSVLAAHDTADATACRRLVRVVKDGNRLFRVDAVAPDGVTAAADERALAAVRSFRLLAPENRPFAEPLTEVRGDSPCYSFAHPASWERGGDPPAAGGSPAHRFVARAGDVVVGSLFVEVEPRRSGRSVFGSIRAFTDKLRAGGLRTCGSPIVPLPTPDGFTAAHIYAPVATLDARPAAVAVVALEHPAGVAILAALSPSPQHAPLAQAMTRRAFEIVRSSFRFA